MKNTTEKAGLTMITPEAPINERQVGISKVQIAKAYKDQIEKIIKDANNIIKLKDEDTKTLEERLKQFETDGGQAGDLRAAIELLSEIADKKDKSVEELKQIGDSIESAKKELESLEFFKDSAFDLVALTNTKNNIIASLDAEIKEIETEKKEIVKKRNEEEKEFQALRKVENAEYEAKLQTTRDREEEEYEYNFKIKKRTKTNELEETLENMTNKANAKADIIIGKAKEDAAETREEADTYAKETRITIEDELRVHNRKVEEFEDKTELFEELKKKVEDFPAELKEAVSVATKAAEGRAKGINDSKISSAEEIKKLALSAKDNEIASLKDALEKAEAAVTKAEEKADKAITQMADIANARSAAATPQVIVSETK